MKPEEIERLKKILLTSDGRGQEEKSVVLELLLENAYLNGYELSSKEKESILDSQEF